MDYVYRTLAATDASLLKQLLKVFADAFEDQETYQKHVPTDTYLESLLAKPHFIVLVALAGEEVIGGIAAYELEKFEQERKEIYIYDLAVAVEHRRQGVATNLIKELRKIAKKRDTYVMYVQADKGDAPAIALYESLGTKEDVFHFDIQP